MVSLLRCLEPVSAGIADHPHESVVRTIDPRTDDLEARLLSERHDAPLPARDPVVQVTGLDPIVPQLKLHATGQVGPPGHGVLPLPADGLEQLVVTALDRDIDRSRSEVQRPYGVPAQAVGVADRDVVLEVRRAELDLAERAVAASLDEALGELEQLAG